MTTIQVRIDKKTKQAAKAVLDALGIDMSTAIKAYFKQISIQQGLPFRLLTENGLTRREENEIHKAALEAKQGKNTTKRMSIKDAISYLNEL